VGTQALTKCNAKKLAYIYKYLNISALEGSRASIFALRSKSHGPLPESSFKKIRKTPKLFCFFVFWCEKISFSNLLETLDSDRGPWDLDLSAKMEDLDPSRAEILRYLQWLKCYVGSQYLSSGRV